MMNIFRQYILWRFLLLWLIYFVIVMKVITSGYSHAVRGALVIISTIIWSQAYYRWARRRACL
jgi:hypothetical protein